MENSRHSTNFFFALAFCLSWAYWVPLALARFGWLPFSLPASLVALAGLGTLGPTLAALVVAFREQRGTGIGRLLKQWQWRAKWRWLGAATLVYPALALLSVVLYRAGKGQPPLAAPTTSGANLLLVSLFLAITVLGEEIGWRGYALPALQDRWSALGASLILGSVTTLWHLPFWLPQPSFAQYGWVYLALNWIWILAATICATWLMNNSGNNLLLAFLFHWSFNLVNVGLLPVTGLVVPYLLLITFSWSLALALLFWFGPRRLVRAQTTAVGPALEAALK
jgi:membrane protease YdiL (CAAX protease family)